MDHLPAWLTAVAQAARTSLGFFWKAGWAFVLGYCISAMIQTFVPRKRLASLMGAPSLRSVGLATGFGAVSSSCSFAALAAGRALFAKGAHFVATVAFLFASTNLVVELGILIVVFLGWRYLAAELVGGLLLITISSLLIRATYPRRWVEAARRRLSAEQDEDDFAWRDRIRSREGWGRVGRAFLGEWRMVWQEVVIGFTVAGIMATFVPAGFWEVLFLARGRGDGGDGGAGFWVVLENALVAPFVAAATFIGSMGNIPLATVLASGGVSFAGLLGFIYSDLMVPPLVRVNARYYGWRLALYVAAVMFASIVTTALALHYVFLGLGLLPTSTRPLEDVVRFEVDYTFWLDLAAVGVAACMVWLSRRAPRHAGGHDHGGDQGLGLQDVVTWACLAWIGTGALAWAWAASA